jgi:mannose-1-phosphate guanylyltransferase/mannose-1-phosphate guanylyltransferase/mannose-6-phosphate isomerase
MVRASFDWIDVGSWDEYARLLGDTGAGAVTRNGAVASNGAKVYAAGDCGGCFVDSDIPVALAGVKDLIVVIRTGADGSPRAALIAKKGETQRVRDIAAQINKAGK